MLGGLAGLLVSAGLAALGVSAADAQAGPPGPPAVGVFEAVKRPITQSNEFLGRIEAPNRVNVVARVTAFLEKRNFVEGAEVKAGDLLYQLERGPFEADLASKKAQARSACLISFLIGAGVCAGRPKRTWIAVPSRPSKVR